MPLNELPPEIQKMFPEGCDLAQDINTAIINFEDPESHPYFSRQLRATPLVYSLQTERLALTQALLANGANPNQLNHDGIAAIFHTYDTNVLPIVKALQMFIQYDVDLTVTMKSPVIDRLQTYLDNILAIVGVVVDGCAFYDVPPAPYVLQCNKTEWNAISTMIKQGNSDQLICVRDRISDFFPLSDGKIPSGYQICFGHHAVFYLNDSCCPLSMITAAIYQKISESGGPASSKLTIKDFLQGDYPKETMDWLTELGRIYYQAQQQKGSSDPSKSEVKVSAEKEILTGKTIPPATNDATETLSKPVLLSGGPAAIPVKAQPADSASSGSAPKQQCMH